MKQQERDKKKLLEMDFSEFKIKGTEGEWDTALTDSALKGGVINLKRCGMLLRNGRTYNVTLQGGQMLTLRASDVMQYSSPSTKHSKQFVKSTM